MTLNDEAKKNSTSAELEHKVSNGTFLTSGSRPAGEAVAQEVTLFVLTTHRTSLITWRRRALVWNICGGKKEKGRQKQSIKC